MVVPMLSLSSNELDAGASLNITVHMRREIEEGREGRGGGEFRHFSITH